MDKSTKVNQGSFNPVDRGWAWVILVCVFIVQVNCFGILRFVGVVFVPLQEKYNAHASVVSLIPGIQAGIFSLAGMLTMSLLIEQMSIRNIVRIGGLLSAAGISLCFFADSIAFFYISHAILSGVGVAMCFGTGFVLLGIYFEERRPLAVAIANVGGSVGTLVMPLVTRFLLEEFSLFGTYLLLGGIFAQTIVMAGFFTPPSDYKLRKKEKNGDVHLIEAALLDTESLNNSKSPQTGKNSKHVDHTPVVLKTMSPVINDESVAEKAGQFYEQGGEADTSNSDEFRPRTYSEGRESQVNGYLGDDNAISDKSKQSDLHQLCPEGADTALLREDQDADAAKSVKRLSRVSMEPRKRSSMYLNCDAVTFALEKAKQTTDTEDSQESDEDHVDTDVPAKPKRRKKLNKRLESCFDTSLFHSPLFWLLMGIMFCGAIGVALPNVFLPPLAIEKGLTMSEAALLLTIIGALDIISRLVPGFVAQMEWLKPQTMVCIASTITGTAFQFTAFLNTPAAMMGLAVVMGLCAGVFVSMMQLITIDFVGLDRFAKAFGMVQMALGIAVAAGNPFIGYLRDLTGSFVIPFHVIGVIMYLSVVLLLLEPCVRRLDPQKIVKQPIV